MTAPKLEALGAPLANRTRDGPPTARPVAFATPKDPAAATLDLGLLGWTSGCCASRERSHFARSPDLFFSGLVFPSAARITVKQRGTG